MTFGLRLRIPIIRSEIVKFAIKCIVEFPIEFIIEFPIEFPIKLVIKLRLKIISQVFRAHPHFFLGVAQGLEDEDVRIERIAIVASE